MNAKLKILVVFINLIFSATVYSNKTEYIKYYANLFEKPDSHSQIVKVLGDGEIIQKLKTTGDWSYIQSESIHGWIKNNHIRSELQPSPSRKITRSKGYDLLLLLSILIFISILIAAGILAFFLIRRKQKLTILNPQPVIHDNTVILIAKEDKNIFTSIKNTITTVSTCIKDIGFSVIPITNINLLNGKLITKKPAFIIADGIQGTRQIAKIDKKIGECFVDPSIPIIIYNASTLASLSRKHTQHAIYYLLKEFTYRDLIKIVSKFAYNQSHDQAQKILQGKITEDGLFEVLQFIEASKKTGILRISKDYNSIEGTISFVAGVITFCRTIHDEAEKAVKYLLKLQNGKFDFFLARPYESNCSIIPTNIMLETMKEDDEMLLEDVI